MRDLSRRTDRLLRHGDRENRHNGSVRRVTSSLVNGMVAAGWPLERVLGTFQRGHDDKGALRGAQTVTDEWPTKWQSKIKRHYNLATARQFKFGQQLAALRGLVLTAWPSGRLRSAWRLALGLIDTAESAGSLTFVVSHRRLAEMAGVGAVSLSAQGDTKAITTAAQRLIDVGLVVNIEQVDGSALDARTSYTLASPDRFRARLRELVPNTSTTTALRARWSSGGVLVHSSASLLHVAWEVAALGVAPCRVWHLLRWGGDKPLTTEALASGLNLNRNTVANALKALDEYRLAERVSGPRSPWRALDRDLDDVADELRVLDRQDRRSMLNTRQRQGRKHVLEQRAAAARAERQAAKPRRPLFGVVDPETGEILPPRKPLPSEQHDEPVVSSSDLSKCTDCGEWKSRPEFWTERFDGQERVTAHCRSCMFNSGWADELNESRRLDKRALRLEGEPYVALGSNAPGEGKARSRRDAARKLANTRRYG